MRIALSCLLIAAVLASCAGTDIGGVAVMGVRSSVSETDIREAIAAGTDFGGQWGSSGHFRVAVVQVINHNEMRLYQEPHGQSWVTVTRKGGKWKYGGLALIVLEGLTRGWSRPRTVACPALCLWSPLEIRAVAHLVLVRPMRALLITILFGALAASAAADTWSVPTTRIVQSQDGNVAVRIDPNTKPAERRATANDDYAVGRTDQVVFIRPRGDTAQPREPSHRRRH